MEHVLKCWPEYYFAVATGEKTFEVRKNDRNYQVGDTLHLHEYDPETERYSGNRLSMRITYKLDDEQFVKPGYVILGIQPITP